MSGTMRLPQDTTQNYEETEFGSFKEDSSKFCIEIDKSDNAYEIANIT